jgi:hypothetical protein
MSNFVKWMDKLPLALKIIFALPILDIIWNVYRLVKSCKKNNVLGIILAAVLIVIHVAFVWVVDIITICTKNKVLWID